MAHARACCGRCGGTLLRPARNRNELQRRVRSITPLERYACSTCGHRGWRFGKLPEGAGPGAGAVSRGRGGRPDRGSSALPAIVVALALGAATAWFILRTAAGQP